jgi:hypothetical protein
MKKRAKYLGMAVGAWDTAWKVVAIRRAVKCRQWRWLLPLATVNSVGILPMLYLARWSRAADEPDG